MPTPLFQVDAFTDKPFAGNPAAVCLLEREADETWMQNVAMEMNLAETAFVVPRGDDYDLRWFTPNSEVDLCGHATLAAAHILYEEKKLTPNQPARFHTRSGLLIATRNDTVITLDFPAEVAEPCDPPSVLIDGLGVTPTWTGQNRMDYLAEVASADVLRKLEPDFPLIAKLGTRGLIVTAKSDDPQYDFMSRYFAPAFAVNEDPVTGSAHCCLGPYWQPKLNKTEFVARQISKRAGTVRVSIQGDRIHLAGHAVTTMTGQIVVTT